MQALEQPLGEENQDPGETDFAPEKIIDALTTQLGYQDDTWWAMADSCIEWAEIFRRKKAQAKKLGIKFYPDVDHASLLNTSPWKWLSAEVGRAPKTLSDWARTAKTFPPMFRFTHDHVMTFLHHQICASQSDPIYWIEQCRKNDWSVKDLKEAIAAQAGKETKDPCPMLERRWCLQWMKMVPKEECDSCYRNAPTVAEEPTVYGEYTEVIEPKQLPPHPAELTAPDDYQEPIA